MKEKFSDYNDLFSLLLDSFQYLESEDFSIDYDFNLLFILIKFIDSKKSSISFMNLVLEFFVPPYNDSKNRNQVAAVLMALDSHIYCFDEYYELFENHSPIEPHHNDKYYVLIRPKYSLSRVIDEKENLRNERFVEPNSLVEKMELKKLCFIPFDENYRYCVRYTEMKSLENKIISGKLQFKYLHMVKCVKYGKEIITEPYNEINVIPNKSSFSVEYKNQGEYTEWYLKSLKNALLEDENDIIITPEITLSNDALNQVEAFIKSNNINRDILIVCGSNWNNRASVIHVFNAKGELLTKHYKCIPFEDRVDSNGRKMSISEDINVPKPYTINLLHIKDVGLFGFVICSDMLSNRFIDAYVAARITNLVMCSFSYSSDIFYDLTNVTSKYNVVSSACNICFPSHKVDGYLFLPSKLIAFRWSERIEAKKCEEDNCINCKNKGCCGSSIKIDILT